MKGTKIITGNRKSHVELTKGKKYFGTGMLNIEVQKIFRHAEYESARRDLNFLWDKSLSY